MRIEIYNRLDLVNPIETINLPEYTCTVAEFFKTVMGEQFDLNRFKNISVYADGHHIVHSLWEQISLSRCKNLRLIISPKDAVTIASIVIAIIAVAFTVYSYMMAAKMPKNKNRSSSTSSIYDPNAQGNKVKLEDPIPEQFGYVKAFPDLISEYHYYYKNNLRYMDVLLCQGVGHFDHPENKIFIGNTPITDYDDSLYRLQIADPGEDISGHSAHRCWYSSTEVTSSGHEIVPYHETEEDKDTGRKTFSPVFSGNTFEPRQSSFVVTAYGSSGPQGYESTTAYDLKYNVGDVFKIYGMSALPDYNLRAESQQVTTSGTYSIADLFDFIQQDGNDAKVYLDYLPFDATDFKKGVKKLNFVYSASQTIWPGGSPMTIPIFSSDKTYSYTIENDSAGTFIRLKNCDVSTGRTFTGRAEVRLFAEKANCPVTRYEKKSVSGRFVDAPWYVSSRQIDVSSLTRKGRALAADEVITISGTTTYRISYGGPSSTGRVYANVPVSETHLYKIVSLSGSVATVDRDLPSCPYSNVPIRGTNQQVESATCEIWIGSQAPFSYPYRDGNGYYRVIDVQSDPPVLTVQAVSVDSFDYTDIAEWSGFPFSGIYTCNTELLTGANSSQNGKPTTAGAFRACPRGIGARFYELDFTFPSGLYRLDDDGDYQDRTASIKIEFRPAGSNTNWTEYNYSWTAHSGDEIGTTISFDMANYNGIFDETEYKFVAYEFRVTNTSEYSNDAKVVQKIFWNGLKCQISDDTSYEDVTVIALSIKGAETLSESSENQISTYWTRKLPGLTNSTLKATSSVVPAVKYICGKSRFNDLFRTENWTSFHNACEGAGIEFNFRFDDFTTILEAIRQVILVGYAEPVVNGNTIIPVRKVPSSTFVQMFSPQNMVGEPKITLSLLTDDTDDELDLTYMDGDKGDGTWKEYQRFVRLDPQTNTGSMSIYQQSSNVQNFELLMCTDEDSAYRLALRKLREMIYLRQEVQFKTELDALNCQYGDVVLVALPMNASLVSGRIVGWSGSKNRIVVDQILKEEDVTGVIYIRRPDGSVWGGTCVYESENSLILTAVLDWSISAYWTDTTERPYFCFGEVFKGWVKSIKPNQTQATVIVTNYSDKIFVDDKFEGYGISPYGTSQYGSK